MRLVRRVLVLHVVLIIAAMLQGLSAVQCLPVAAWAASSSDSAHGHECLLLFGVPRGVWQALLNDRSLDACDC